MVTRFHSAHHFEAFLGVVSGERSSGEKRRLGHITKAGSVRARYLLVEAGWRILRAKGADTAALRLWALAIAARRGKRIAVVALARRLAGILRHVARSTSVRCNAAAAPARARRITTVSAPPRSNRLTDVGGASASQLMAAAESR
jgi:hypothetical protein